MEAWSDVGSLGAEVREHERLMALLNALMGEARNSLEQIWRVQMRDIGDAAVLRRKRMMQLAALTMDREGKPVILKLAPKREREVRSEEDSSYIKSSPTGKKSIMKEDGARGKLGGEEHSGTESES